ncbi:MAG: aldehyde dehydrogenase [Firmicutes bacterium GWF2_51_9]|nr:MAG: aldehyde dehydrogenase [Firmicutes bacterium GWF2_51_9]OGS58738.1 MAG: aldehyde dehydrogenase [Firmicutes bacterium GWE2_51_13]HAO60549.1 aldehyde dehydrogenase [Erysipelotrichaceae bacterium]HBZ41682.1 aldehyde dehydrogenase [Erysipelotrichaceae bacterium]
MSSKEYVSSYVKRAKAAQKQIQFYTQEQIDEVCVAIGWEVYNDHNIEILAKLAVEETKMGNVQDKITKHKNKVLGVLKDVQHAKSVGCIEVDEVKKIRKFAKPVGVVGALTPVTNPTATPASNGITILKGRNAVIFAPHPRSKKATAMAVQFMRDGLRKVNAPEDLIQVIDEPSIEVTEELMKQVDVVLATGGGAMVKAAYSSGKPAYGVGPGNSVSIVAEDANVKDAATKIMGSKAFDHATSCSSENSIIIHESIYDQMIEQLISLGAYLVSEDMREQLSMYMWPLNDKGYRSINPKIIAQSARSIAQGAMLTVDDSVKVLLVEGREDIESDFFSQEKLSPVLTVFKYATFEEGYRILERLTDNYGTGHSCGIHTFNDEYVKYIGSRIRSSRVLVNQAQAAGNGGAFFNGMPSTVSLGCGSWGGNITSENITYKHFINTTWVSEFFPPVRPSDEEIFGAYFASGKKDR